MLTQSRLKEVLKYDPEMGVFTSRINRGRVKTGDIVGCFSGPGYLYAAIDNKTYPAHGLAFLYMTGEFPPFETDHINGVRTDNRWSNLRAVTQRENAKNKKMQSNNKSGVTGVHWSKGRKRWQATIRIEKRAVFLGYYSCLLDAVAARYRANREHGFHPNHGRLT